MRAIFSLIDRVAESGTGKELVARELHHRSLRSRGPLISVNCAAIPEDLIESELFGHERGSFTGAHESRKGKFEQADGGTLFLDEVADMSPEAQAKLLRMLEHHVIERVGGIASKPVDVRVISATNQDLSQLAVSKQFREDLFYRLDVIRIEIPPLRERADDIPLLFYHFLNFFSHKQSRPLPPIAPGTLDKLAQYPFPGNVRQLRNVVERLLVLADLHQGIVKEDLPREIQDWIPENPLSDSKAHWENLLDLDFRQAREAFEVKYLLSQLRKHDNNITHTARAIGLHRQSLQQKIKDLSLREWI